jgi:hypothetical protein
MALVPALKKAASAIEKTFLAPTAAQVSTMKRRRNA